MKKLTIDRAKKMGFKDLIEECDALVEQYAKPEGPESQQEYHDRLSRTLDELPDVYRWFLTLHSWFDHWTDFNAKQFGMKSDEYKQFRQKRDAMERAASAAKRRYEGASRLVTMITGFDESAMPRGRG